MIKHFTSAIVAVFFTAMVFAQTNSDALSFTREESDPLLRATAGAGIATPGRLQWGAFHGSASAAFAQESFAAGATYGYLGDKSLIGASVGWKPDWNISVSAGINYFAGPEVLSYKTHDLAASLGVAYRVAQRLSIGLNARYAVQSLSADISKKGFSADLGLMYLPLDNLSFTAGVSTLGTKVKSEDGTAYSQPSMAYAGAWYSQPIGDFNADASLSAEFGFAGDISAAAAIGFHLPGDIFHINAAYRYATKNSVLPSRLALGVGTKLYGFTLDLTYNMMPAGKSAHCFSVGVGYAF